MKYHLRVAQFYLTYHFFPEIFPTIHNEPNSLQFPPKHVRGGVVLSIIDEFAFFFFPKFIDEVGFNINVILY